MQLSKEQEAVVINFAEYAGINGWNNHALTKFCRLVGISDGDRNQRWPKGVRTLGWELNSIADRKTLERFQNRSSASMVEIVLSRFEENAALKSSVKALAVSDIKNPWDTLLRTAQTADLMWRCCNKPRWPGRMGRRLDTWLVVIVYSFCVIIWLQRKSPADEFISQLVRRSFLMIGLK
jgi:hypothetical protein